MDSNHWAWRYISVAFSQELINGYTDGTFRPNNTVSYAEAITMIIRALKYDNEIDSSMVWPENYINKAISLNLLENIDEENYGNGAIRGNIAILLYNALNCETKQMKVVYPKALKNELNIFLREFKKIDRDISYYYELADLTKFEDVAVGYLRIGQNNAKEAEKLIDEFINICGNYDNTRDIINKLELAKSYYSYIGKINSESYSSLNTFKLAYLTSASDGLQLIIQISKEIDG